MSCLYGPSEDSKKGTCLDMSGDIGDVSLRQCHVCVFWDLQKKCLLETCAAKSILIGRCEKTLIESRTNSRRGMKKKLPRRNSSNINWRSVSKRQINSIAKGKRLSRKSSDNSVNLS